MRYSQIDNLTRGRLKNHLLHDYYMCLSQKSQYFLKIYKIEDEKGTTKYRLRQTAKPTFLIIV